MYWILLGLGLAAGGLLVMRGITSQRKSLLVAGLLIALATVGLFGLMSFWGEALWYAELGYASRFWKLVITRVLLGLGGGLLGAGVVFALCGNRLGAAGGGVLGAVWWFTAWETVLLFLNGAATGQLDPIFGRDLGFYFFALPFFDTLLWFLLAETWLSLLVVAMHLIAAAPGNGERAPRAPPDWNRFARPAGVLALLLAGRFVLAPFHLLYSRFGTMHGAGWTDVWVRRPGYYVVAATAVLVAVVLLVPALRRRVNALLAGSPRAADRPNALLAGGAALVLAWAIGVWIFPALFQWLRVAPNEITVERPYIAHNIEFTRRAFGLQAVEYQIYPVSNELTEATLRNNQHILSEVRLWDPRALAAVYKQFQEIRLYYEMDAVDIDRYLLDGEYRQVMVSAREMRAENLPDSSQTFVNRRFKYTHGFGLTMSPVSVFRLEGLPEFFIKDLPPKARFEALEVERPEIYFGERTTQHVVANSEEQEFDYPRGEQNAYAHYAGKGGVPISNLWRRILFGWKFDGTKLLVSTYLRPEARILFHREIKERVSRLAPFLTLDEDPYIVVAEGRLYWIIDGYTTSSRYPYSQPFGAEEQIELPEGQRAEQGHSIALPSSLYGANYLRNSVKAVVDAYDGAVDLYVFAPDDPLISAWSRAFPGLVQPRSSMPPALEAHVRYPEGLLLAQAMVYSKYHMTDPEVFYNQEDLWVRATEKYYEQVQPVDPYYVMWEPSGSGRAEFVLMQPFTPRNRQVLIGWIAGMCDPPNYGRLLAYHFPKEKRVLGTQQVDTKIDQDPVLSAQLTLWNQEGKRVIRGNVLVIPIGDTLLYVEPIYIQAEVAAYPELRLVVVMHNDHMSYAPSFDEALAGLVAPQEGPVATAPLQPTAGPDAAAWRAAVRELNGYLTATSEGRFAEAGMHLERLHQILEEQSPAGER